MVPAIVFSRDRACQLDALLDSLRVYAPSTFAPVRVLYTSSDADFENGYARCAELHPEVIFVREANFREDTLLLIPTDGSFCFLVDDDIAYRPIPADDVEAAMRDELVVACSLRLGINSTYCYPLDQLQPMPPVEEREGHIVWRWLEAPLDYGYPLSLDGHVLRAVDVRRILDGRDFANPNQLEDVLARHASALAHRPLLASLPLSALVGIPANRVNVTHPNRFAGLTFAHVRALNDRFLAGERIDRGGMDFSRVRGAHQEIDLHFWAYAA